MELCLFQGTFNPIHTAHIRVAEYALKNFAKDGVLFIPAYNPPHKQIEDDNAIHRFNMVKLAIESNPKFKISDIEYKRQGKSYTYLTICELYKIYNIEGKIKFIIGTDAFRKIESWYETDKLKEMVDFLLFTRDNEYKEEEFQTLKSKGYNYIHMPLEFEDISSTDIRERIKEEKPLTGLVPQEVEEYIYKNDIYKD